MASVANSSVAPPPVWRRVADSRLLMGGCYALAAVLTFVSLLLGSSPTLSGALGPASPVVFALLGVGFVLLLFLAGILAWRLLGL